SVDVELWRTRLLLLLRVQRPETDFGGEIKLRRVGIDGLSGLSGLQETCADRLQNHRIDRCTLMLRKHLVERLVDQRWSLHPELDSLFQLGHSLLVLKIPLGKELRIFEADALVGVVLQV